MPINQSVLEQLQKGSGGGGAGVNLSDVNYTSTGGQVQRNRKTLITQSAVDVSELKLISKYWYLKVNFLVPENLLWDTSSLR